MDSKKNSIDANDRPNDASISQTAEGVPDDSGRLVEVDEAEVSKVRDKLLGADSDEDPAGHPS